MVILSKVLSICSLVSMRVVYPVADLHTKVSGTPPPTGPNSFIFTYVFTEKCLCQRLAPPPKRVGAPPTGNPGSAPGTFHKKAFFGNKCRHQIIFRIFFTSGQCISLLNSSPLLSYPSLSIFLQVFWGFFA